MQKVYLLLRSNKQTGPYSLEELLQLNLKPFDLVWVDGRSAAWQYPFEIPALKPYVPETPHAEMPFQPIATAAMEEDQPTATSSIQQPRNPVPEKTETPKRVFVSIPKTYTAAKEQKTAPTSYEYQPQQAQSAVREHKAYMPPVEEPMHQRPTDVKQTTPSYAKASQKLVMEDTVATNYSRSLHDVEEDYTKWVYQQKAKKKVSVNPRDLAIAVLLLAVIGGGYYVMSKPSITNSMIPSNKAAAPVIPTAEQVADESEPKEILSPEQRVVATPIDNSTNGAPREQVKNTNRTKNQNSASRTQTVSSVPQVENPMPVEKTNPNIHEGNTDVNPEPRVNQQPKEPTDKKKKLGEVIKGIFAKKDKKEEPVVDAPAPQEPKPSTNRQASRRDESADADEKTNTQVKTANLMEQVDLSSNAPDNWMLGVKNLKIVLRNRSNVTIQTASVTVSYYDENSQLLDKKIIYFNNVAPKAKATAAAPDHKFADHVDYKLTTISAKEDRYASN
jgi:hypothetical protein